MEWDKPGSAGTEKNVPYAGCVRLFYLHLYSGQTSSYFFHWYLYGNHAGSTSGRYIPEDREEKTPDFFDLNMKVAYDFPLYKSVTLQVNAGVQNILEAYQSDFDQGKDRDSKYIYGPGMPRSYFVGCKISY